MSIDAVRRALAELSEWYEKPLGGELKGQVAAYLNDAMSTLVMREAVNLGLEGFQQAFAEDRHKWATFFSSMDCQEWFGEVDHCLPLKPDSQECVVLTHGLDIAKNPLAILRELGRVVAEDGYVIVIGFNPLGPIGPYRLIRKLFRWQSAIAPWSLKFFGVGRLRDCLALLNFETHAIKTFNILPYSQNPKLKPYYRYFDSVGLAILPRFGNIYVLIAKKCTIPVTPMRMQWKSGGHGILKPGLPGTSVGKYI